MATRPQPSINSSRLTRSVMVSRVVARRFLWVWPLVAVLCLVGLGYWLQSTVERAMATGIGSSLTAILNVEAEGLRRWMLARQSDVLGLATDDEAVAVAAQLVLASEKGGTPDVLKLEPGQATLKELSKRWTKAYGFEGFLVATPAGRIVGSSREDLIGRDNPPPYNEIFSAVAGGRAKVSAPFKSIVPAPDANGNMQVGVPTMIAAAPIMDDAGKVTAIIGAYLRPEADFTDVLNAGKFGNSGETYAFNKAGLRLSQGSSDEELRRIGLLAEGVSSILNLEIKDPEVDMSAGERPPVPRAQQKPTKMANEAITSGGAGVDPHGYRNYRGQSVVGAWRWVPEYEMGIATEQARTEAYQPLNVLRIALWLMFGLLFLASVVIFVFTLITARLDLKARRAALQARHVGNYQLENKLGSGGMGVVYRARHALMRRPTAVKLLDIEKTSPQATKRFEREVQLTSQLNHPNTISIFDYGRTPEGIFYYAMEYLEGLDLESLIEQTGPLPEGRVVHILMQVCGSLAEAHAKTLVHRDIKPANVILCCRGGVSDFAKVLDFGLVKALDDEGGQKLTAAGAFIGTPQYMSPESIEHTEEVDARSDLYSLGTVAYFLLTGKPPFTGASVIDVCAQQVSAEPETPSSRLGHPVNPGLEAAIMKCLAKKPADRPQTAAELARMISDLPGLVPWTIADADAWWAANAPAPLTGDAPSTNAEKSMIRTEVFEKPLKQGMLPPKPEEGRRK